VSRFAEIGLSDIRDDAFSSSIVSTFDSKSYVPKYNMPPVAASNSLSASVP
jgi:hypothetical protein